jgi:Leucine-rich repeat (LRR) protein
MKHKKVTIKLGPEDLKFPIEVLNIKDITELEIIGGSYTYIPPFINELKHLSKLSIVSTYIEDLPVEIFEMNSLRYLSLKNNRIKYLPNLSKPSKIESLILNKNLIENIDDVIFFFKDLNYLDLGQNKFKAPPKDIAVLKNLKRINLEGNSVKSKEFIRKSIPTILSISI